MYEIQFALKVSEFAARLRCQSLRGNIDILVKSVELITDPK